jgi:hypothetical protein
MFYSPEQVQRIERVNAVLNSSKDNERSLCQTGEQSCVRCCLPHIGGDSPYEHSKDERTGAFNEDNQLFEVNHENRYVGPQGLLMKFSNIDPLGKIGFSISHFEDSFEDVGKEEMDQRLARRRELFKEVFDPNNPSESLKVYTERIQQEESYGYHPEKDSFRGLGALFMGGSIYFGDHGKDELPECHMLGFIDDDQKRVGCLAHPLSDLSEGFDGRMEQGFFAGNDSCVGVNCSPSKNFKYLSDSALKVFDKTMGGMSWYDYSRHATGVFVSFLRGYDHIIQMLDQKGKLDSMSLEGLVEFTNELFDNWKFMAPRRNRAHRLEDIRIPQFPVSGEIVNGKIDIFSGSLEDATRLNDLEKEGDRLMDIYESTSDEYSEKRWSLSEASDEEKELLEKELADLKSTQEKAWAESRVLRDKREPFFDLGVEVPYSITTVQEGYEFRIDLGEGELKFDINFKEDNRPEVSGEGIEELWRIIPHCSPFPVRTVDAGKSAILGEVSSPLSSGPEYSERVLGGEKLKGDDIILDLDVPVSEKILYSALRSVFFEDHLDEQLRQAREIVEKRVDSL